jgi:valyl-tRNA synthetase
MMMMGLHFMGDVPFRRVLLHGMVVDETGEKMSKVKANTIDPLDLIHGAHFDAVVQKALPGAPVPEALTQFKKSYPSVAQMGKGFPAYGADALRYTLCSYSPQAKRIALSPKRIEGYRNFCNKIYNAVRFALGHIAGETPTGEVPPATLLVNRWILSRLASAVTASARGIEGFRLDEGSGALYHFFWDELCDWFLEITKPIFASGSDAEKVETRAVLAHVVETALRALHPYAPFITEELWQRVPRPGNRPVSVALAPYPTAVDGRPDEAAEGEMNTLMAVIGAARSVRSEHAVHPGAQVPVRVRSARADVRDSLTAQSRTIATLVKTQGEPIIEAPGGERPRGFVVSAVSDCEVLVGLAGLVERAKEAERMTRDLKRIDKDIAVLEKRLASESFVSKAPVEVVNEARALLEDLRQQRQRLLEAEQLLDELD